MDPQVKFMSVPLKVLDKRIVKRKKMLQRNNGSLFSGPIYLTKKQAGNLRMRLCQGFLIFRYEDMGRVCNGLYHKFEIPHLILVFGVFSGCHNSQIGVNSCSQLAFLFKLAHFRFCVAVSSEPGQDGAVWET